MEGFISFSKIRKFAESRDTGEDQQKSVSEMKTAFALGEGLDPLPVPIWNCESMLALNYFFFFAVFFAAFFFVAMLVASFEQSPLIGSTEGP
jgi:hypothetical protein